MAGWEEERRRGRDGGVAGGDAARGAGKRKERWEEKIK
jgi:hypothetical protein